MINRRLKTTKTFIRSILLLAAGLIIIILSGCDQKTVPPEYQAIPSFDRHIPIVVDGDSLKPVRMQLVKDTLFISYTDRPRIDLFDIELNYLSTIRLDDPEPVFPTDFFITDSTVIVSDHSRRLVIVYDRRGQLINSFGTLPDGKTQLLPYAVTYLGGVAYVGDVGIKKILAVSLVDAEGVTELGELILTIPADPSMWADRADSNTSSSVSPVLGFPSALHITWDGRLLVGDAMSGTIEVFTCSGTPIYSFDTIPFSTKLAPQGFAYDNISDYRLEDSSSFDPSGIRKHGRIHVVDANNRIIHIYSTLGKYIASYPDMKLPGRPAGIVIDRQRQNIYISIPTAGQIFRFKYEKNKAVR